MDERTANVLFGVAGLAIAAVVVVLYSLDAMGEDGAIPLLGIAIVSLGFGVVPFERLS